MNCLLLGYYEPPVGGVAVHVKRLATKLSEMGYPTRVLDFSGVPKSAANVRVVWPGIYECLRALRGESRSLAEKSVVHVHACNFDNLQWALPALRLWFAKHARILTIHGGSFVARHQGVVETLRVRAVLSGFHSVITVNAEQRGFLESLRLSRIELHTIPAYIASVPNPRNVPPGVTDRISGRICVLSSGWAMPVYNFEPLIRAIEVLERERYFWILALYDKYDAQYERMIATRLGNRENVLILRDMCSEAFAAILAASNIYVRTTLVDGDSVAIREALSLGKTVLATDCVCRPGACELFKAGDSAGLVKLIQEYRRPARCSGSEDQHNERDIARVYCSTGRRLWPQCA